MLMELRTIRHFFRDPSKKTCFSGQAFHLSNLPANFEFRKSSQIRLSNLDFQIRLSNLKIQTKQRFHYVIVLIVHMEVSYSALEWSCPIASFCFSCSRIQIRLSNLNRIKFDYRIQIWYSRIRLSNLNRIKFDYRIENDKWNACTVARK